MRETTDLEHRLEKLETHLAFLEQTVQQLNASVTGQWSLIDKLKQKQSRLSDQLAEVENTLDQPAAAEPPPHY